MWSTIFNGIGKTCQYFFEFLPAIGMFVAILFWCTIAIGSFYWLFYGMKLERGGANYLGEPQKEDEIRS